MKSFLLAARVLSYALLLGLLFSSTTACSNQTVIQVPPGEPIRLRETVKNVKVWIYLKDEKKEYPAVMDLEEGRFVIDFPEVEEHLLKIID